MLKSVEGIYRDGKIELLETPAEERMMQRAVSRGELGQIEERVAREQIADEVKVFVWQRD